jgi:phosphoadenosine phosphosulfate reductase
MASVDLRSILGTVSRPDLSDDDLAALSSSFETAPPSRIIGWAVEEFGTRLSLTASMTDAVLIDLAVHEAPGIEVVFIDTGYHFPETLGTRDAIAATYPINLINVTPERTVAEQDAELGPRLYGRNPDLCCYLRKVVPLERALDPYDAWITAARRTEDDAQGSTQVIEWDARRAMVRVNPIAGWTPEQVNSYIAENGVVVNPLVDEGYPSIGCATCTLPKMKPGADPRSDRWADTTKSDRSCGHALIAWR